MFFAAEIGMAQGEETRKLLHYCGRQLGVFTSAGLDLWCRTCKVAATVPYGIRNFQEAEVVADRLRRRPPRGRGGSRT